MRGRQQPRQPGVAGRGAHLALVLACLLALSRSSNAQAIFDLLTGTPPAATTAPSSPAATTMPAAGASPSLPAEGSIPASPAAEGGLPAAASPALDGSLPTASPSPATGGATPVEGAVPSPSPSPVPAGTSPAPVGAAPVASPSPASTAVPVPSPSPSPAVGAAPVPVVGTSPVAGAPPATVPTAPVGTPPVNMPAGSDTQPSNTTGTIAAPVPSPPTDTLPPSPPADWSTLTRDTALVFYIQIRGPYITPFTNPKRVVLARVLRDRYLRSCQLPDIVVDAVNEFPYMDYDAPNATTTGGRRLMQARDLLQVEKSGANLKITVATSQLRVESEINTVEEGVDSGAMAADFTLAGIQTDNLTMLAPPTTQDQVDTASQPTSSSGMQGWVIGVIVGAILLVLPAPTYLFVRWRKRRSKEAAAVQAAEAEAARLRMQSRVMRPGSKSFTLKPGGSAADIMVMSGSMGGLAGFHNNGRLASWSGSPERFGQAYTPGAASVSRAASVTSMGSALPSGRTGSFHNGGGMPQRVGSMPGQPRGPGPLPTMPPAGSYEDELQTARSNRSQQG